MFHILHAITPENSQGVSIITCLCIKLFDFICLILIKNSEFEQYCLHLSHIVPILIEMPREFISTKSLY